VRIQVVRNDWPRFGEILNLYYEALYSPFGISRTTEWYHPANGSTLVVALEDDGWLLGGARLLPPVDDPAVRQVRQVVVREGARGRGIGRALMAEIERVAAEQGAREIWLNAREAAFGFYEALGWEFVGDEFVSELTRVPHREMRKRLAAGG
jgi:predicted GNAT family N-acyltransferase